MKEFFEKLLNDGYDFIQLTAEEKKIIDDLIKQLNESGASLTYDPTLEYSREKDGNISIHDWWPLWDTTDPGNDTTNLTFTKFNLTTLIQEMSHSSDSTSGQFSEWATDARSSFLADDPTDFNRAVSGGLQFATVASEYNSHVNTSNVPNIIPPGNPIYTISWNPTNPLPIPATFKKYCEDNNYNVEIEGLNPDGSYTNIHILK